MKTILTENNLNKSIKKAKRSSTPVYYLFVSPWDRQCDFLRTELKGHDVNLVDSFETPHGFEAFKVKTVPTLVKVSETRVDVFDHITSILIEVLGDPRSS